MPGSLRKQSFFWQKLEQRTPRFGEQMPLGQPPLPGYLRSLVADWIRQGARRD